MFRRVEACKKSRDRLVLIAVLTSIVGLSFWAGLFLARYESRMVAGPWGFFTFVMFALLFWLFFLLQIIIHELGHLIFGLISGYSFISLRILSFVLIKDKSGYRIKRFNQPGTLGQSIMKPPKIQDGYFPFLLYNLGGSLLNLMLSIPFFLALVLIEDIGYPQNFLMLLFGAMGILIALLNISPLSPRGLATDGLNVLAMVRAPGARRSFYNQLLIQGHLCQGVRPRDFELEGLLVDQELAGARSVDFTMTYFDHQQRLDSLDFEGARRSLERLDPYLEELLKSYRLEVRMAKIFLELVSGGDRELINELYDQDLKDYINAASHSLSSMRFNMAYQALYLEDREGALKTYERVLTMSQAHPLEGEAQMELDLAGYIKGLML